MPTSSQLASWKAGAEWATSDSAKLSQGGEHEQEADFINLLIKNKKKKIGSSQNDCFWH